MDIYLHELAAYKREISTLVQEIENGVPDGENSTHFGLGVSNRANMILIGMCSLVEALLYEIAAEEEAKNKFKIDDLKGNGLKRLQNYISRTDRIDFGKISEWGDFNHIYTIRNALVHSYGGLVDSSDMTKVKEALKHLKITNVLVMGKRIRITSKTLPKLLKIVEGTINGIKFVA
jgi:hypothetical protein